MSNILSVILNLIDNLSPGLDAASGNVENLEKAIDSASNSIDTIDNSGITDLESAANAADLSLEQVGEAASMAGFDINSIDPSNVQETKEQADGASDAADGMASSFDLVTGAVEALIGLKLAEWITDAVGAAGTWSDAWDRMAVAMGLTVNESDAVESSWSGAISSMQDTTGRGAAAIKEHITGMEIMGVNSADSISSSWEAVSGMAYLTGNSIETIESAFNRVVRTGTLGARQLTALGLSEQRVHEATGLSVEEVSAKLETMDANGRAAYMAMILNASGATEANDAYKVSWEHTVDVLNRAWAAIQRIIGGFVLPIVTPIIESITGALEWFADVLKGLDPTIKTIIGAITLFGGALASGYLMINGAKVALAGLEPILGLLGIEAGSVGGIFGTLAGILSGPVGWAILAITAAVAAAIFIWQNWSKEIINFKNAIMSGDWGSAASQIGDSFNYIGDAIYSALVNAGQQIWTFFAGLPAWIGENYTAWLNMGRDFLLWIVQGLTSLSGYLSTTLTEMMTAMATDGSSQAAGTTAGQSTGKGIIDGLKQWLIDNGPLIGQTLVLIFQQLLPLIGAIFLQMGAIVAVWVYQEAIKAGQRFINGFLQMLAQLPGLVLVGLIQTVLTIAMWGYQVWSYALWAGSMLVQGFVSWLSQLPGIAWMYFLAFLNYLGQLPGIAYGYAASTGNAIVSAIGSYLSSLPGQMYSWGMNALGRFVDGIINSIPGLSAALATVRSLFPASPPKKGPLSEIKGDNMEAWMRGIMESGSGVWDDFTIGDNILGSRGSVSTGNGGGNTLNLNVTVDGSDSKSNKEIARDVEQTILSSKMIKQIDIGLGKLRGDVNRSRGI